MKKFLSFLIWFFSYEKKYYKGNSEQSIFTPNFGLDAENVSIVQEAPYKTKNEKRSQDIQSQNKFLNEQLVLHNIDISNYTDSFFNNLTEGNPGERIKGQSDLGKLFLSLSDGTFVPNKNLGEK